MRLGCTGCLFVLAILLGVLIVGVLGGVLLSSAIFTIPGDVASADYTLQDGRIGQQKLAEILLRDRGFGRGKGPVVITQRELNGFLAHHLQESGRIPMKPLIVRLAPGILEIQGQTTFGRLFTGFPFSLLGDYLPRSYIERPIWVTVKGRIQHDRSRGSLEVLDFSLGTQPISPRLLSWMLGRKGQRLLHWQMPGSVERIVIEEGRLVVTTR
jgi:hypothetical protein